jgi:hypothetical protein
MKIMFDKYTTSQVLPQYPPYFPKAGYITDVYSPIEDEAQEVIAKKFFFCYSDFSRNFRLVPK